MISSIHDDILTESDLDERLSRPSPFLIQATSSWRNPLVVVGAGGKMGPSIAIMARRAAEQAGVPLRVIAVSRFTDPTLREILHGQGVETLVCDVLDRVAVAELPDSENVVYLVGMKFGTHKTPALTWALNTLAPVHVAERYPAARMVALSTGNVYPLVKVDQGGASEDHPLTPLGEYGNAAVARERLLGFMAAKHSTSMTILRLNYAVELRYGILVDLAQQVWEEQPVDVTSGWFNCIWQGDANDRILRALDLTSNPPATYNLTGQEILSIRETALKFGSLMNRQVRFTGTESDTALLSDASRLTDRLGIPSTPMTRVMEWITAWIAAGGRLLNRPTHYAVRNGVF
jgi:hypothetical protein